MQTLVISIQSLLLPPKWEQQKSTWPYQRGKICGNEFLKNHYMHLIFYLHHSCSYNQVSKAKWKPSLYPSANTQASEANWKQRGSKQIPHAYIMSFFSFQVPIEIYNGIHQFYKGVRLIFVPKCCINIAYTQLIINREKQEESTMYAPFAAWTREP